MRKFAIVLAISALSIACGDDDDDGGGGSMPMPILDQGSSPGSPNCADTFAICGLDAAQRQYETCYGPANTTCWYRYRGTDYVCDDCNSAAGCENAATQVLAAICN